MTRTPRRTFICCWNAGDGETAIRVVRSAQARSRELTVIVPNQAKSAGTILLMGAHHILMGPTSDLGPVDPQFPTKSGLYSAKDLIAAAEHAEKALAENPESRYRSRSWPTSRPSWFSRLAQLCCAAQTW